MREGEISGNKEINLVLEYEMKNQQMSLFQFYLYIDGISTY